MNQEDKELLLKDLCSRLPYKIRCSYYDICLLAHCNGEIYGIENKEYAVVDGKCIAIGFIKPYLFPLSSMTEEQKREYHQSTSKDIDMLQDVILKRINGKDNNNNNAIAYNGIDWLNANHFDYRGLIEKGLAIDATGLNIY